MPILVLSNIPEWDITTYATLVCTHTHHMYPPNRSNLHHLGLEVSTDVILERVQNNQPVAGKTQVHCVQESHGHTALLSQDS